MKPQIANLKVNGQVRQVIITPNMTLSEVLRGPLDLTGTKQGCGVGQCGSCTVLVDGTPTLSCSTLAIAVRDSEILTIEGLSTGDRVHPVQKAFVESGAIQCGYCTPGMILMAVALLNENPDPTRRDVREWLGGNLCRCTGYVKIVDAVIAAAQAMQEGDPR